MLIHSKKEVINAKSFSIRFNTFFWVLHNWSIFFHSLQCLTFVTQLRLWQLTMYFISFCFSENSCYIFLRGSKKKKQKPFYTYSSSFGHTKEFAVSTSFQFFTCDYVKHWSLDIKLFLLKMFIRLFCYYTDSIIQLKLLF